MLEEAESGGRNTYINLPSKARYKDVYPVFDRVFRELYEAPTQALKRRGWEG